MYDSPVHEMLYGQDEMDIPVFTQMAGAKESIKETIVEIHENEFPKEYYEGRLAYFSSNFTNPYYRVCRLKEYVWWEAGLFDQSKEHFKWKP